MDKREILRRVPLFAGLSEVNIGLLAANCRTKAFAPKKLIFAEGTESDDMYVIVSGRVEVFRSNDEGEEVPIAERGAGEVIGEMAMLDCESRSASVRALESCSTVVLQREAFLHCLKSSQDLTLEILATLVRRLRESDAERATTLPVRERIVGLLLKQGKTECSGEIPSRYVLRRPLSRTEIARLVRCTRETASREMSMLQREGIVRVEGRIISLIRVKRLFEIFQSATLAR